MNVIGNQQGNSGSSDREEVLSCVTSLLHRGEVASLFQPIVDIGGGHILGFEVFSRGTFPYLPARTLFSRGREAGFSWELETLCRKAALRLLGEPGWEDAWKLFLNVSPEVLADSRLSTCLAEELLISERIRASSVVLEMTSIECDMNVDMKGLEASVDKVRSMGFRVAQDDMGADNAGLAAMLRTRPDFIKLDRFLIQNIQRDRYRQDLVRSFVEFAEKVNAVPIAEGVETWEELDSLVKLGLRYFQGFLFGRPESHPVPTPPEIREKARECFRRHHPDEGSGLGDSVSSLVRDCVTVLPSGMTGQEADGLFRKSPDLDHLVILTDSNEPCGLVTRQDFFRQTGGAFGYHLFERQPLFSVAKTAFLSVSGQTPIQVLSRKAMERGRDDLYDPVVVIDEKGAFLGTITMKQIIVRSGELEIELALNSNPLTGLPGNRHIEKWIMDSIQLEKDFTIVYADLDRFKEYNDRYGFIQGDQLICLTGDVLRNGLSAFPAGTRLGHVGGDDFVFVCPGLVDEEALCGICRTFDERKEAFFSTVDRVRGFYEAEDRRGEIVQVRLVTLSLAAVESRQLGKSLHPAELTEIAASLKHRVKQITAERKASAFCFERRDYNENSVIVSQYSQV